MIRGRKLNKEYHMGASVVHALRDVDIDVESGQFVSIVGASGSGKSTLMHILGCLDQPTSGTLEFRGEQISTLGEKPLAQIRNRHIGFVFQTFNLINRTTSLDNVLVPLVYTRKSFSRKIARQALERVGLGHRLSHRPGEMSGGECQRVAIARAIVNHPELILADEPTGNLDSQTGRQIMDIFHELHAEGITVVLVTHEMDIAAQADRIIRMKDGSIVEDLTVDDSRRRSLAEGAQEAYGKKFHGRGVSSQEGRVRGSLDPEPETIL